MDTFIYDGTRENLNKARELYSKGVKILCYKCHAELIINSSAVVCPVSEKHICILSYLKYERDKFWNQFKDKSQKHYQTGLQKQETKWSKKTFSGIIFNNLLLTLKKVLLVINVGIDCKFG